MIKYFPLSILLLLIVSCNEIKVEQPIALEDESIFPKVKKITELKNTDFSPTLESTFNPKKIQYMELQFHLFGKKLEMKLVPTYQVLPVIN